jgi:hypothetical protein
MNELDTSVFYSPTCAEIKHLVHVTVGDHKTLILCANMSSKYMK